MDHGLPLLPVITGVVLAYAADFAYTLFHRARKDPKEDSAVTEAFARAHFR
jgi:hypothetical protein